MRMSIAENRAVIERFFEAQQSGDFETAMGLTHDDMVLNVIGRTPVSGRFVGRDEIAWVGTTVFEQLIPEEQHVAAKWRIVAAEGDCVVALMQGGGPTKGGVPYDQTYCQIFQLRDGRIAEMLEFLDTVVVEAALFGNMLARPQSDPEVPFSV